MTNDESESDADNLKERVLAYVLRPDYQPVKPRVIARKLGLPKERHEDVKRLVKRLTKLGQLSYGSKHLVQPPSQEPQKPVKSATSGVFRRLNQEKGIAKHLPNQSSLQKNSRTMSEF